MSPPLEAIIERLHQPQYTGENRCLPCTLVNLGLGAIGSGVLARRSRLSGLVGLGASLGLIYLRGYLVPGTPTLTQRYFPDRVLRLFDKDSTHHPLQAPPDEIETAIDPEAVLTRSGVLEPCETHDDLCLSPHFRITWRERIEAIRGDEARQRTHLANVWDVPVAAVGISESGVTIQSSLNNTIVESYYSRAGLIADIAAGAALKTHLDEWAPLSVKERNALMTGLRLFLSACPACDGPVTEQAEAKESCCRSQHIVTLTCQNCGAALLKIDTEPFNEDPLG